MELAAYALLCWLPAALGVAQATEDPRFALEHRRLQLDQAELQLARERFEYEKSQGTPRTQWYDWPPLGWLAGLFGVGMTWFLTRMTEREKHRRALVSTFDQDLRRHRIEAYRKLWLAMKPLSLYTGHVFKRSDAAALRLTFRDWYFGDGLFLSGRQRGTRERYFALQHALVLVSRHGHPDDVLAQPADNIEQDVAEQDQRDFVGFSHDDTALPATVAEAPFMQYRFLRALGSLLRTETVNDVHTRVSALEMPAS